MGTSLVHEPYLSPWDGYELDSWAVPGGWMEYLPGLGAALGHVLQVQSRLEAVPAHVGWVPAWFGEPLQIGTGLGQGARYNWCQYGYGLHLPLWDGYWPGSRT